MGCTQSNDYGDGQPKMKPVPLIANSSLSDVEKAIVFRGVFPKQAVLCRDEFQSKYTNELMYRWRPAEIIKVEGESQNRLLVHYSGWADTFDHWVDIEVENGKLAPEKLLSKDQSNRGGELTEDQASITRNYFLHGTEYTPYVEPMLPAAPIEDIQTSSVLEGSTIRKPENTLPVAPVSLPSSNTNNMSQPVVAKRRTAGSSLLRPPGDDTDSGANAPMAPNAPIPPAPRVPTSPPQAPQQQEQQWQLQQQQEQMRTSLPSSANKKILAPVRLVAPIEPTRKTYVQGDQVEVLDIFFKKGATKPSQKWRPAEIVEVVGEYVTIHYDNWDDKYNERLHVVRDAHRLGPLLGSRTSRNSNGNGVESRRDIDANTFTSSGSVNSNASGNHNGYAKHTRSDENMSRNMHTRGESDSSTSSGLQLPAPAPPVTLLRPPASQTTLPQRQTSDINTVAKASTQQDFESSELDKGPNNSVTTTSSTAFDRKSLPVENKPPALTLATPSTDAAGPDTEQLTPEQRNFTRNFFNYKKKKQAELQQATMGTISEGGPTEENKKKEKDSESPRGNSVRKGLAKMTFGGLFGASKDSLGSKSGSPRSAAGIGKSESTECDENDMAVAVPVEEEKTEDERLEEEIAARERLFLEKLEAKGLHVFAIEGDGNCLFRAISHQLYLEQDRHDELRARCVEHLIRHRKRFEVFSDGDFEEHLKEMSKPGTWADDLEIRALEEITDRVITIYSSTADTYEPINNNFEEKNLLQGVPPLTLSYHGSSHYNSIYDERYPLPLVERKSRLLLRSRLALTQQDLLPSLSEGASSRQSAPSHPYAPGNGDALAQYSGYNYEAYSQSGSSSQHSPGPAPSAMHGYPAHLHEAQIYGQAPPSQSHGFAYPPPVGYVDPHGQYVETDPNFANVANMDYYYEQPQQQEHYEAGYDPALYEAAYEAAYEGEYAPEYDPNVYIPPGQHATQPNAYGYAPSNGYTPHPHPHPHQQQHLPAYSYGYSQGY